VAHDALMMKSQLEKNMSRNIKAILNSVQKLHGDTRDQHAKYDSFIAWQIKQRLAANHSSSSILKINEDDPCDVIGARVDQEDAAAYEATFGLPL
jgi:hypothetical protein